MRFWMLATAAVVTMGSPAAAQDVMPGDWSGFYAGVYAGYGVDTQAEESSSSSFELPLDDDLFYSLSSSASISPIGTVLGEVRAGYNFQHDALVLGLEGSIGGGQLSKSTNFDYEFVVDDEEEPEDSGSLHFDSVRTFEAGLVGSFTGRIGVVAGDWLLYGKGGVAVTHARTSQSATGTYDIEGVETPIESSASTSGILFGTTFAVGAETKVTERVSIGAEVGMTSFREQELSSGSMIYLPAIPDLPSATSYELDPAKIYTAKFGVNYRF